MNCSTTTTSGDASRPPTRTNEPALSRTTGPLTDREFKRILIVKPSSLGDIVHALPVLSGLRTRYPEADIRWLVADNFAPLIADHPDLNGLILFDRNRFRSAGSRLGASVAFYRMLRELRGHAFDLVLDLQGLFRSGFMARATGASVRIGFRDTREFASIFYTHKIQPLENEPHAADRNYLVSRMLGFDAVSMKFDLALTQAERSAAAGLLSEVGLEDSDPFVAVLPGARWETKRWDPSRIAAAVDRVHAETGVRSVLFGAPDERSVCSAVADDARSNPLNLCGKTGIRGLVASLARAAAVLTHDSGPMHIAVALGRPLVAIIGPTNAGKTGPYGVPEAVRRVDLPCAPCYLKRLSQCPHGHECMRSIEVAEVADALIRLLSVAGWKS
jgi:lipopolysaccharide heptosyltransferase I